MGVAHPPAMSANQTPRARSVPIKIDTDSDADRTGPSAPRRATPTSTERVRPLTSHARTPSPRSYPRSSPTARWIAPSRLVDGRGEVASRAGMRRVQFHNQLTVATLAALRFGQGARSRAGLRMFLECRVPSLRAQDWVGAGPACWRRQRRRATTEVTAQSRTVPTKIVERTCQCATSLLRT